MESFFSFSSTNEERRNETHWMKEGRKGIDISSIICTPRSLIAFQLWFSIEKQDRINRLLFHPFSFHYTYISARDIWRGTRTGTRLIDADCPFSKITTVAHLSFYSSIHSLPSYYSFPTLADVFVVIKLHCRFSSVRSPVNSSIRANSFERLEGIPY